jgi:hypothetical protein
MDQRGFGGQARSTQPTSPRSGPFLTARRARQYTHAQDRL